MRLPTIVHLTNLILGALVSLLLVGCGSDGGGGSEELEFSLEVQDKFGQVTSTFLQGEELVFLISIQNSNQDSKTLTFPTSQQYEFVLRDAQGMQVWLWSLDTEQLFLPAKTEVVIASSDSKTYEVAWNQQLPDRTYLPIGQYELVALIPGEDVELGSPLTIQ